MTNHVITLTIDPRLTKMLQMQRDLQLMYNKGKAIEDFSPEERMRAILENAYSLCDEIHEATAETGWKPWASSNHINTEKFHGEMVDAWHFFMNLMLHSGMTADDLFRGYMSKHQTNIDRQANEYTGVKEKCPLCKRAYDDAGVKCTSANGSDPKSIGQAYCAEAGRFVE
jgi:dimeric dUTPase (all-alpha-NTP-PPase superfamily)